MIRSSLAVPPRIIAFILALHLFAAIGFTGTVPPKRKHRRVNGAHKPAAAKRPARAAIRPAAATASRPSVRVSAVQRASVAGPRPVAPAAPIIAGGPWTSPTYADSTNGDNIDGEDLDIRRAAVDALGTVQRFGGGGGSRHRAHPDHGEPEGGAEFGVPAVFHGEGVGSPGGAEREGHPTCHQVPAAAA